MTVNNMTPEHLRYNVGPLLYMPALRTDIAEKIVSFSEYKPISIAICLEDTIRDDMVEAAEKNLMFQMQRLAELTASMDVKELPLIFIRVRTPGQMSAIINMLGKNAQLVCGFILSKIDDIVFSEFLPEILKISVESEKTFFYMPIIENSSLLCLKTRHDKLYRLYEMMMAVYDRILNVRVGGNDFSSTLALKNDIYHTIYDLIPVANILADIFVTFGNDYIVSAPVWNYFDNSTDDLWRTGLLRELALDKHMGFVGKTVIHPSQIPVVIENMKVTEQEYNDARILLETVGNDCQVIKSVEGNRMYEHKVHRKWAEKIIELASAYGIRKDKL